MKGFFFIPILVFNCLIGNGQNADINLLREINVGRNKNLDGSFEFLSNTTFYVVVGTPVIITATGLILKDKQTIKKGLLTSSSIVVNELLTLSLKYSIKRTRPYKAYPDIDNQADESDASFPSGHTSNSFALATSLSMDFPKWYVIAPSYLWAGSVGYSRMHLGVHYPTDVLAGALIGTGSAILCSVVNKRFLNRVKKRDLSID